MSDRKPWEPDRYQNFARWVIDRWMCRYDAGHAPSVSYSDALDMVRFIAMGLEEAGVQLPEKLPERR